VKSWPFAELPTRKAEFVEVLNNIINTRNEEEDEEDEGAVDENVAEGHEEKEVGEHGVKDHADEDLREGGIGKHNKEYKEVGDGAHAREEALIESTKRLSG
jgi:hypothetical protein